MYAQGAFVGFLRLEKYTWVIIGDGRIYGHELFMEFYLSTRNRINI